MGVRNEALAAYVAEPSKRGGYRSQKLPGGEHSALHRVRPHVRGLVRRLLALTLQVLVKVSKHLGEDGVQRVHELRVGSETPCEDHFGTAAFEDALAEAPKYPDVYHAVAQGEHQRL